MSLQSSPIEFAGDNPCVVLYDKDRNVATAVSFWSASSSRHGVGQVLFLLQAAPDKTLKATVLTDNVELAVFLSTINQHFEGFQATSLQVSPRRAEIHVHRTSETVELHCKADTQTVRVSWTDLGAPDMVRSTLTDFGGQAGLSYEVSSVVVPATSGSIVIDDQPQPGHVVDGYGTLAKSAFLAFCETWTRIGPDKP